MGNKCQKLCTRPKNQILETLKNQSEQPWVKNLDLDKSERYIVSKTGSPSKNIAEIFYNYVHNPQNYLKGVIISSCSIYEGDIDQQHRANGKGLQRFIYDQDNDVELNKGFYLGQWKNNARNGKGKYEDKHIRFEGKWKNGFPLSGDLQIRGKHPTPKYKVILLQFNNLQATTGTIYIILPDETKYQGEFVKNELNMYAIEGRGILTMSNGDKYDGMFKQGKFHGAGVYTCKSGNEKGEGRKFQGEYKNGLKDGMGKLYTVADKKYIQGRWTKGKKQGKFKNIEVDGNGKANVLSQISFINDQLQN